MKEVHRVAYVMSRFPGLSETFILREMCEMERLGWGLELYPLVYQDESIIHDEARSWMNRAWHPALFYIFEANIRLIFTRPLLYFSILFRVLFENVLSPKFLSRAIVVFPKSVWMARQMSTEKIAHIHAHYATHPARSLIYVLAIHAQIPVLHPRHFLIHRTKGFQFLRQLILYSMWPDR